MDAQRHVSSSPMTSAEETRHSRSSSGQQRTGGFMTRFTRGVLLLSLGVLTVVVPATGFVGSDSALSLPARAVGNSVGATSWASGGTNVFSEELSGSTTAASRARVRAPITVTGCLASSETADGSRSITVLNDRIYWPLAEGTFEVTSGFAMRVSPISGQLLMHEGVDMSAPMDTPIYAVADGEVTEVGENSRSGAYVQMKHQKSDGTVFYTAYLHQYMDKILVKVGDRVSAGTHIGAVGSNGWSTGPHLHFEVHNETDQPVDPMEWMQKSGAVYVGQESCQ